jgi:Lon protease-like protein
MTNFIPIFPLPLIVFPGEILNLHIFEPRYKQLIQTCIKENKPFGIPPVLDGSPRETGTLIEILEIVQLYEDGRMEIRTRGVQVFRVLEWMMEIPEKLYSGAIVHYLPNFENGSRSMMQKIMGDMRKLHEIMQVNKKLDVPDDQLRSYDVAHHVGLSLEEEYELLGYENELHRQEFLKRHLTRVLPVAEEMKKMQQRIMMNGHFKDLEGFSFN